MQQQPGGGAARPGGALKGGWIATTSQLLPFLRMKRGALGQRALLVPIAVMLVASANMIVLLDKHEMRAFFGLAAGLLAGTVLLFAAYRTRGQTALLAPVALVAIGLVTMIVSQVVAGLVITVAIFWFVYRLCGKPKPLWFLGVVAFLVGLAISSPFDPVAPTERLLIHDPNNAAFWQWLWVGVVEETFKALPVVGAYFLGRSLSSPQREDVGIGEPLDGILVACASATGFAFFETLGGYSGGLVPRPLGSIAGHLAYSGFLGYAIGLAALKPASAPRALAIGFVAAAGMHGVWDWLPEDPRVLSVAAVVFYAVFASAVLKARDISPSRDRLQGSIWLGTKAPGAPAPEAGGPPTPPAPQPSPARPALQPGLYLRIGERRLAVAQGLQLREGDVQGLRAQANGVVADVNTSPRDPTVLGLRNLSTATWIATPPASGPVEIPHGRSIRLQPGTKIAFGVTAGEVERI